MPATPALIVRHAPQHRSDAIEEVRRIMAAIGEPGAIVRATKVEGNLKVIPEGDAHEAQEAIANLVSEAPGAFRFTSRWTVADQWVHTDLQEIRRAVAALEGDLGDSDSWKLAVRPGASKLDRERVLDAIAPLMHRGTVDLDNPSKELRIDILGDETAIGIVNRAEVFHNPDRNA